MMVFKYLKALKIKKKQHHRGLENLVLDNKFCSNPTKVPMESDESTYGFSWVLSSDSAKKRRKYLWVRYDIHK